MPALGQYTQPQNRLGSFPQTSLCSQTDSGTVQMAYCPTRTSHPALYQCVYNEHARPDNQPAAHRLQASSQTQSHQSTDGDNHQALHHSILSTLHTNRQQFAAYCPVRRATHYHPCQPPPKLAPPLPRNDRVTNSNLALVQYFSQTAHALGAQETM